MTWLVGALGLLVGFLIGVVSRDALDLMRASRKESRMPETKVHSWSRALAVVLLILTLTLNVVVGGLLIKTRINAATYSQCVARWQQDFSTGYKARYDASVKVSTAMDAIVEAVGGQSRDEFTAAIQQYRELRATQKAKQQANPLPPLPETLCGTPGGAGR